MTREKNSKKTKKKGFPLQKASIIVAVVFLAIAAALLYTTASVAKGFREMKQATEDYIEWQSVANEMRTVSDYLTEQARMFFETGEKKYVDAYCEEVNSTKRREKIIESFRPQFEGLSSFEALEKALEESKKLSDREYYAMRLKVEAMGADVNDYPEEIVTVVLDPEDAVRTADEKNDQAREILFGKSYRDAKENIYQQINTCIDGLTQEVKNEQTDSLKILRNVMIQERAFIVIFILMVIGIFVINSLFIFRPILHSVTRIKNDELLNVDHVKASEMKYLAEIYNDMLSKNKNTEAILNYKATHDPLTDVNNRSGLDDAVNKTSNTATAILVIDVDDYKVVNDIHGHETGDRVLKDITVKLKAAFPGSYIARIGGDEFCIILPVKGDLGKAKDHIVSTIDCLNEKLRRNGDLPVVSLSCGVGFCRNKSGREAMRDADKALYEMKRTGKGGCRLA